MRTVVLKIVTRSRVMALKVTALTHVGRDAVVTPQASCRDQIITKERAIHTVVKYNRMSVAIRGLEVYGTCTDSL